MDATFGGEVPPHLHTGRGADPFLRFLARASAGLEWLNRRGSRRRPPVVAVDRDLRVVVDRVRAEAEEVVSLRLRAADGSALPAWQPGAHLDVVLPSGRIRQYSLCGSTADRHHYRVAVRRIADGGGGSREVHDELGEGSALVVRGPRNAFPFVTAARYLFVAGGIGITPILPMVRTAAARGADWRLVYTGRSRDSMPFLDELAALDPARVWIRPDREYGVPASGSELLEHAPSDPAIYCCGPTPMITGVRIDARRTGQCAVHWERFSAPPVVDGRPFQVELATDGRVLDVPADRSALDVIRELRPQVAYSCRQGFCGTCRVEVVSGAVEHRDHVLTDDERGGHMMICVSRARGDRLVVDL
ncbi:ferredoxin-NADP reductase [Saccharopolyspora erythraea NRRL 2338]|uniref:PDR/VanB family oxidoreductase n=2 Tax=Saccharopolyspora erythraea TaxID=1836 RepID=A0ABN1CDQ2_SACER|nr:PDR/VanB family oxidoreductase [Saccharopolyspora erythraea]PFG96552.1 ferredoxin-NADP reductase [Saccharopolyspora erythraea NRRL 2338]QRK93039.1 oxidoreductase [Saccharopolyspora erythraea]CAM02830.1 probable phthalate 4,5-dioxygenase [Saccharopolyspora erythraea NRRL 2338]